MSSDPTMTPGTLFESYEKPQERSIPEMPSHWIFERDKHPHKHSYFCWWPFFHCLHHLLCVIGLGHVSMHRCWETCYLGCSAEEWEPARDALRERMEHINIVAGLLFTAIAAFCSTDPPGNGRMLPYTEPVPYIVLLVSVSYSLGGLIVGSAAVFTIHKANPVWFRETMMGSQPRIWVTMVLLSFPFVSIGISTCTAAAGLLIAASYSEFKLIRVACYFVVVPPLLCGVAFGWMLVTKTGVFGRLLMRSPRIPWFDSRSAP